MIDVKGKPVDDKTICENSYSPLDIMGIKFTSCNTYYSCYTCHEETAGHAAFNPNCSNHHYHYFDL